MKTTMKKHTPTFLRVTRETIYDPPASGRDGHSATETTVTIERPGRGRDHVELPGDVPVVVDSNYLPVATVHGRVVALVPGAGRYVVTLDGEPTVPVWDVYCYGPMPEVLATLAVALTAWGGTVEALCNDGQ